MVKLSENYGVPIFRPLDHPLGSIPKKKKKLAQQSYGSYLHESSYHTKWLNDDLIKLHMNVSKGKYFIKKSFEEVAQDTSY